MVWAAAKLTIRPDDYIADVLAAAAFKFIDIRNLAQPAFLSLLAVLAGYGSLVALLRWMKTANSEGFGVAASAAALGIYWIWFDESLLPSGRYNLRILMLIMIPSFSVIALPSDIAPRFPSCLHGPLRSRLPPTRAWLPVHFC
jgi:hypothetical protein